MDHYARAYPIFSRIRGDRGQVYFLDKEGLKMIFCKPWLVRYALSTPVQSIMSPPEETKRNPYLKMIWIEKPSSKPSLRSVSDTTGSVTPTVL